MSNRKVWTAHDAGGNLVQASEVTWPEDADAPDLEGLQANVEAKGLTFAFLDDDAELPAPPEPEPAPPTAEETAAQELVAKAKAAVKNRQATDEERMRAATFLRSMGEL